MIKLENNTWIEGDGNITIEAICFFRNQFSREHTDTNFSILNCIPRVITDIDNDNLLVEPSMDEIKDVVFSMSSKSNLGTDDLSGKFYHSCWDIIKHDLLLMIYDPKSYYAHLSHPYSKIL